MKKNRIVITIALLIISLFVNNKNVYAISTEEMCSDSNVRCFCLKKNEKQCTLQTFAPSGHNYKIADKTSCGCIAVSPEDTSFCEYAGTLSVLKIVGQVLFIIKIIVPIILIIMGMVTFGKATMAGDDGQIKAATTSLIKKAIAAVVVFLIPYAINAAFKLVDSFSTNQAKFVDCTKCLNRDDSCDSLISAAKAKGND